MIHSLNTKWNILDIIKEYIIVFERVIAVSNSENLTIRDVLKKVLGSYLIAKTEPFKGHNLKDLIVNASHDVLLKASGVDKKLYRVRGSVGQFETWTGLPWIALLRRNRAENAKKGYYIVYLFRNDLSGVYISLNQGVTYFNEKYKKSANENLNRISSILRSNLHTIPAGSIDAIDLKSDSPLAGNYKNGHICGFYYDNNNIPKNNQLIEDLKKLIVTYEELNGLMKNSSLEEFNDFLMSNNEGLYLDDTNDTEDLFQDEVNQQSMNEGAVSDNLDGPENRPEPLTDLGGSKKWPRVAKRSAESIANSNYTCSVNNDHISFTSRKTKRRYVEAHHLVPMSWQKNSTKNLDRVVNIVALCPNCHRLIHHGDDEERRAIILKLFTDRKEALIEKGIEISIEQLFEAYDFSDRQ